MICFHLSLSKEYIYNSLPCALKFLGGKVHGRKQLWRFELYVILCLSTRIASQAINCLFEMFYKVLVSIEQLGYDDMLNNFGKSKKKGKDQESIQLSFTPDPGYQWESDSSKLDIRGQPSWTSRSQAEHSTIEPLP